MQNIILTGFSYTGKSHVGRLVAASLGWEYVDTDDFIVRKIGLPIHRIFVREGETNFRRIEKEALVQACSEEKRVISTGGGIVLDEGNRQLMRCRGTVVCLDALPETIHQRLKQSQENNISEERPLLNAPNVLAKIRQVKNHRQHFYAQAHWTVHTDNLTLEQTASEVIRSWELNYSRKMQYQDDPLLAAVVSHSTGNYQVLAGWGILDQLGERLKQLGISGTAYIVSDENVFVPYVRKAQISLEHNGIPVHCYTISSGESAKSLEMAQHMYQWLVERKAERKHAIIAVGGGVVGDLAGYVAATFLRGLPLVHVPTSLTAMVDSSIGGKVAVNLSKGKNLVGAFHQPKIVMADVQSLTSLGKRELVEGWAEAVKHGLILDAELFQIFEDNTQDLLSLKRDITIQVIMRSMAIKARVVSEDERETKGRRILLNYGHTIGHALETVTNYGQYLHGEAVSIGMMGAAYISQNMGLIDQAGLDAQECLLKRMGLPIRASGVDVKDLLQAMTLDKKKESGTIRWVLLDKIGKAVVRKDVSLELVQEAVIRVTN